MKHSTEELLGVPKEVFVAIEETMISKEARRVFIAILNMRCTETVDDYGTELYKYRKKAIKHYESKDKELK